MTSPREQPDPDPGETIRAGRQIQKGDPTGDAWDLLARKIDAHLARIQQFLKTPAELEFEDLRQTVLCKLLVDVPKMDLRGRAEFWGYVRTVADNVVRDAWRRELAQKRGGGATTAQQMTRDGFDLLGNAPAADGGTPSLWARAAELEERELDCVGKVPREEHRQVYLLRRRDGLDYADIAARVGRNNSTTVKVMYKRTRDRVLACLRAHLGGYESVFAEMAAGDDDGGE